MGKCANVRMLVGPMFSYLVVRVAAHSPSVTFTACLLPPYGRETDGLPWFVYTASWGRRFMFSLYRLSNFSPNAATPCSLNMA